MRVMYDKDVDIVRIFLKEAASVDCKQVIPGIFMCTDEQGHVVTIAVLRASERIDVPNIVTYLIKERE